MAGARGEAVIQTEAGEVRILYTARAIVDIEKTIGKAVPQIMQAFEVGEWYTSEIAHMLRAGMENHRRDSGMRGQIVSFNNALDMIDEIGFSSIAVFVFEAIQQFYTFGTEDSDTDDPNS